MSINGCPPTRLICELASDSELQRNCWHSRCRFTLPTLTPSGQRWLLVYESPQKIAQQAEARRAWLGLRSWSVMFCPQCEAEYHPGLTCCSRCDLDCTRPNR